MNNENSLVLVDRGNQQLPTHPQLLVEDRLVFDLSVLDEGERSLCEEVRILMIDDAKRSSARRASRAEQRQVRLTLGEKLHRLKLSICRPGRNGGWSAFLHAAGLPKRTADRYVDLYRRTINPVKKLASGHISPSPEELNKELERASHRLRNVLRSDAEVRWFVEHLAWNLLEAVQLRTACNDV